MTIVPAALGSTTSPAAPLPAAPTRGPRRRLPSVSAAICTAGRPELLRRALESLFGQTHPAGEVLVIDNAPGHEPGGRHVAADFPGARYIREPVPGLDFARNRALATASGDIVAFLDDDATADVGWVAAIVAAFAEHPELGACTSRVEAARLESRGEQIFEANGGFGRGSSPVILPRDAGQPLHGHRAPLIAWALSVGSGCGLAVRRQLALELGGFDEALDLGAALPGGGDHDMIWRVLEAGASVMYQPDALAWHQHRRDEGAAYEQIIGHQRALIALLAKSSATSSGRRRLGVLAFLGWRLAKPGVRLARRLAGRDPLPAPVLLRMWAHCWRGLAAYPRAQRLAHNRAAAAGAGA